MGDIEKRLERLEEKLGLNGDLKDNAERASNHCVLMAYRDVNCPERFISQAEALIAKYGSLESAIKACGEVDYRDIDRAMTKEERKEYERLKKEIFKV